MAATTAVRLGRVSSEINVTPLVDACLVLLIIFMIVTPLLSTASAPLPATAAPKPIPERPSQLAITLKQDGSILVERTSLSETELVRELSQIYAVAPERDIVIKADRNLKYERVREVIRRIREAGFERVGLITEQMERRGRA